MLQQDNYSQPELEAMFSIDNPPTMQLPQAEMRMIDRVVHVSNTGGKYNKGEIIAEFNIHPDLGSLNATFLETP